MPALLSTCIEAVHLPAPPVFKSIEVVRLVQTSLPDFWQGRLNLQARSFASIYTFGKHMHIVSHSRQSVLHASIQFCHWRIHQAWSALAVVTVLFCQWFNLDCWSACGNGCWHIINCGIAVDCDSWRHNLEQHKECCLDLALNVLESLYLWCVTMCIMEARGNSCVSLVKALA